MIDHFKIKNFLVFEDLEIPQLRRVNLIAGKNNVGKTALLEALRIYFAKGDNTVINNILYKRGLFEKGWYDTFNSLVNRNNITKVLQGSKNISFNELIISKYNKDIPSPPKTRKGSQIVDLTNYPETSETFYVRSKANHLDYQAKTYHLNENVNELNPRDFVTYIPYNPDFDKLEKLWDNIVLTPKEDEVHKILQQTISPDLIRFDVGRNGVKVRLKGEQKPIPLQSLGDGLQRILFLAISLANAQNSYLLIDEIEMGLHHSIMEKLWELILEYAIKWNIQVFATTHSDDMIKSLYDILDENTEKEVSYYRLQYSRTNKLEVITYDEERFKNSLDLSLEIR